MRVNIKYLKEVDGIKEALTPQTWMFSSSTCEKNESTLLQVTCECCRGEGEVREDNMMRTVARQAMMVTAYERVIEKQCLMIEECERALKKTETKLIEKEKTVNELSRINFKQCSALAKFRSEKEEQDKELRKSERSIAKLTLENRCLKSLASTSTMKRNGMSSSGSNNASVIKESVKDLKNTIEETKTCLLAAIARKNRIAFEKRMDE